MLQRKWRRGALFDVINVGLGTFLFFSPWIFDFTTNLARTTSWMAGATITLMALFAVIDFVESEEWINLALGLWVAVCAWIIGFHTEPIATRVHLALGLGIAASAAGELWLVHRTPPRGRV